MSRPEASSEKPQPVRRSLLVILPVLTFAILAGIFYARLRSGADPQAIPSALIGRPVPSFQLEPLAGLVSDGKPVPGLSSADFKGRVTVLNFFSSWCAPCQIEHPMLMRLTREAGVHVVGVDFKDQPAAGRRFLDRNGVPFHAVGVDPNGRTAIDFGVYGVPETFVIGPDGVIRDKLVGIVSPENYETLLGKVRAAGKVAAAN